MIEKSPEIKIENLLLPREKFKEIRDTSEDLSTLEIKNEKQALYFFGANHSRNPENNQYPKLLEYWNKFLKETESQARIVLVEGQLRPSPESEDEGIKNDAEGGFITYLANQKKVVVACPDLSRNELMDSLPEFKKEEFLLSEFILYCDHLKQRLHRKFEVIPQIQRWCDWEKKQKVWEGLEITPQSILKLYDQVLGRPFSEEENFNAIENPNNTGTRINELNRACSDLRDTRVASEIKRYWDEGKSIFVVFGSGHLIIEEPALRQLLK